LAAIRRGKAQRRAVRSPGDFLEWGRSIVSRTVAEVFRVFLKLGCLSFGGPVAHIGYFHDEFVKKRAWVSAATYAEIVALCQFLPGPASSQVGMTLGLMRANLPGALAAWAGFTLPSALLMIAFAYGVAAMGDLAQAPWLHGLKLAAVAVVAQALVTMARSLCPDVPRALFAVLAAALALAAPTAPGQIVAIVLGGLAGWAVLRTPASGAPPALPFAVSRRTGGIMLGIFFTLLLALPLFSAGDGLGVRLFDSFYRAGALVFGGGHVVLPLLQSEVVASGWVGADVFLAGYGAAQAVPGPLFTFAGYVGAATGLGVWGGVLCLIAIFLPSFLLVVGVLPFWDGLRRRPSAQAALKGVNAAVVGLLAAAFYDPVCTAAITSATDVAIAAILFVLLTWRRLPSWLIVILGAAASSTAALI
jgi:chromate transporter